MVVVLKTSPARLHHFQSAAMCESMSLHRAKTAREIKYRMKRKRNNRRNAWEKAEVAPSDALVKFNVSRLPIVYYDAIFILRNTANQQQVSSRSDWSSEIYDHVGALASSFFARLKIGRRIAVYIRQREKVF